jgi:hypothetical protein
VADAAVTAVIAHEHLTQRNSSPTAKQNVIYNLTGPSIVRVKMLSIAGSSIAMVKMLFINELDQASIG